MAWKRDWTGRVRSHVRLLLFRPAPRSRALAWLECRVKPFLKRSKLVRRLRGEAAGTPA
jgi:hypothetical protein